MNNYDKEMQELFLRFMVTQPSLIKEFNEHLKTYTFDKPYGMAAKYITSSYNSFNKVPTEKQIESATGVKGIAPVQDIDARHVEWFRDEFETFLKHKSLDKLKLHTDLGRYITYCKHLRKINKKIDRSD